MLAALFTVLTLLAIWVITAVYCLAMAVVARAGGIAVEHCAVGLGPTICEFQINGMPFVVKPIPLSGYTKLKGMGDGDKPPSANAGELSLKDATRSPEGPHFEHHIAAYPGSPAPDSFQAASYPLRVAILLAGPATSILLGLLLLELPVAASAEKRLARFGDGELIEPSGVPDLRLEEVSPSDATQLQVAQQTAGDYFTRMITFRSLHGWGGYSTAW